MIWFLNQRSPKCEMRARTVPLIRESVGAGATEPRHCKQGFETRCCSFLALVLIDTFLCSC